MGKDISGVGLDPNVIGRIRIMGQEEPPSPRIKNIVVAALTPASDGNALGIGLADVITQKLFAAMKYEIMAINVRTSRFLERIKVPFIATNDADAFATAYKACGGLVPGRERIVRIRDTLHCAEVQVSKAVYDEIRSRVELVKGPEKIFDDRDELIPI
jgi:predicted NBD/HSP70 family sugar kinase